jgi:Zn-dependent protease
VNGDLPVGRIAGIPFRLHWSLFLAVGLIAWSVTPVFFELFEDQPVVYWGMGMLCAVGLFVSVLLHELGHALAARGLGIPVRGIRLFIFGGVAEIGGEPRTPGEEIIVALAGPAVTVVLMLLFAVLTLFIGLEAGALFGFLEGQAVPVNADAPVAVAAFGLVAYLFLTNLVLLVFNMIPAFPLDGGRVLRAILWAAMGSYGRGTRYAGILGIGFSWLLIAWGVYTIVALRDYNGFWSILIGLFLSRAAQSSMHYAKVVEALGNRRVSELMHPVRDVLPSDITVGEAWEYGFAGRPANAYPVVAGAGEQYVGVLTREVAQGALERDEAERTVESLLPAAAEYPVVGPGESGLRALMLMMAQNRGGLPVVYDGRLVGLITGSDLLRTLHRDKSGGDRDDAEPIAEALPASPPER